MNSYFILLYTITPVGWQAVVAISKDIQERLQTSPRQWMNQLMKDTTK